MFLAKKELFQGLWIEDKIDWKPYPVIHLSFGKSDFKRLELIESMTLRLQEIANQYQVSFKGDDIVN